MKRSIPLKQAHRLINHGPVVLVSSQSGDSGPNVLAVAWVTPVCQDPSMAAISIAKGHHSHRLILDSGEYVVNVPAADLVGKVMDCGRLKGRDGDKFKRIGLTPVSAETMSAPLIDECSGHLECRVESSIVAGDHTVFIGRVMAASAEEALFEASWNVGENAFRGLHHLGGKAFAISDQRVTVGE